MFSFTLHGSTSIYTYSFLQLQTGGKNRRGVVPESKSFYWSLLSKSPSKLISASTVRPKILYIWLDSVLLYLCRDAYFKLNHIQAVWMGTRLLFVDVLVSLKLFMKQLLGKKVTEREKKKIDKTLADIATLVPVTILMLIPVSIIPFYLYLHHFFQLSNREVFRKFTSNAM